MASETQHNDLRVIGLSRREALDIVAFLAAQLAGVALQNNAIGAPPSVNVMDRGVVKYRLLLGLEEVLREPDPTP